MGAVQELISCGACHEVAVPAPVFVDEDGNGLNCVEEVCSHCGQLWQFPNYPPTKIRDRRLQPPEPELPEPNWKRRNDEI